MSRTCTAPGCISKLRAGQFLCRPHWFSLPKPLRDEVWRTWKLIAPGANCDGKSPEQRLLEIRAYREATAEAERWLGQS